MNLTIQTCTKQKERLVGIERENASHIFQQIDFTMEILHLSLLRPNLAPPKPPNTILLNVTLAPKGDPQGHIKNDCGSRPWKLKVLDEV